MRRTSSLPFVGVLLVACGGKKELTEAEIQEQCQLLRGMEQQFQLKDKVPDPGPQSFRDRFGVTPRQCLGKGVIGEPFVKVLDGVWHCHGISVGGKTSLVDDAGAGCSLE